MIEAWELGEANADALYLEDLDRTIQFDPAPDGLEFSSASVLARYHAVKGHLPNFGLPTTPLPSLDVLRHLLTIDLESLGSAPLRITLAYARELGRHLLDAAGIAMPLHPVLEARLDITVPVSTCANAEVHFTETIQQITNGQYLGQRHISAYHLPDGTPALLRKRFREPTAITLIPLSIRGVIVPAGTIVAVGKGMNRQLSGIHHAGSEEDAHTLKTYVVDSDIAIRVGRISPWAFRSLPEQMMFATQISAGKLTIDEQRANMVAGVTLEDFQAAARQVMALCLEPQLGLEK